MRGGDEWNLEFTLKECRETSWLSISPKVGESGMVVVSDTKDRFGPCEVENLVVLRLKLGEDCGRPCAVFQELRDSSNGGAIDCVRARLCASGRVVL